MPDMTDKQLAEGSNLEPCPSVLVPADRLNRKIRYTWRDGEQIVEATAIVATHETWTTLPESRSPLWLGRPLGGLVFAIRLPDRPDVRGA